jgi:hypothetical protein
VSTFGSVSALIAGMTVAGIALPALVAVGSLGALAGLYDVMRFIVTEGAVTRVVALWTLPSAAPRGLLTSGPAVPLETGMREPTASSRRPTGS